MISHDPTPVATDAARAPTAALERKPAGLADDDLPDMSDIDALIQEAHNQAVGQCARLLTKRPDCTPGLMRQALMRTVQR